jgi:S1-C subfamily serine protease
MLKWDDVTRLAARLNGIPVLGCRPGSPAARAGVQYGDILTMVNDVPTPDWSAYIDARAQGHDRMRVELVRAGETLVLELALPTHPEPVDPAGLLEELIEHGAMLMRGSTPRPDSEPS